MDHSFLIEKRISKGLVFLAIGFILILNCKLNFVARADAESQIHIVHLGERQHDDPEMVTGSHHQILESLLGSKEAAHESMVYSYRHGFSGFAARLTDSQAKKISELPEVVHVIPNRFLKLQATRNWDYLGLPLSTGKGLLHKANMGSDIIIGVIDSGIWPESEAFNDKGYGPIPKRWKGHCVSGQKFNGTVHCNKKLIGAKYYLDGFNEKNGPDAKISDDEYISPRDSNGHGTKVASIAAASVLPNVSYHGLAGGVFRGGAPRARIAIYKVCWRSGGRCSVVDMWKALDDAVHDGVDVLQISIGQEVPLYPETDGKNDDIALGAFHAVAKGIPVICAGGNSGPEAQTVANVSPWILTVAAASLDRSFLTTMTLGNNLTLPGQSAYRGQEKVAPLIYVENWKEENVTLRAGKVVLAFVQSHDEMGELLWKTSEAGASGIIVARNSDFQADSEDDCASIFVDYEVGTKILVYIRSARSPTIKVIPCKTFIGQPVASKVAAFSSRGPNSISPAILKPDIAAPGAAILLAKNPTEDSENTAFAIDSGTSFAAPVISGIVALLKVLHPDWSPAAIKSAIVTTAWKTDPSGEPIFAQGSSQKLADPFDYGGGLVNPEKAADPGLVYDMGMDDYIHYLCSAGYSDSSISNLVKNATACPSPKPSILDVNLPSITIPDLKEEVTLTRTVTNVGSVNSTYKVLIEPPFGINIVVKPETLVFNSATKKITFSVGVSTAHKVNTGYCFGSLTLTDGVHNVTTPLSVRTQILK